MDSIVGKIRLALTPNINHWWNSTLYVTPRGLTTSSMYYDAQPLQIYFDFISHVLFIVTADNPTKSIALRPCSVAEFYHDAMAALRSLGMPVTIWTTPVEVPDRTPFEQDTLMIPTMHSNSGEFCLKLTACFLSFALVSLAK